MNEETVKIVEVSTPPQQMPAVMDGFSINCKTFQEAQAFCDYISRSDLVPMNYRTAKGSPESKGASVFMAILKGKELGLKPMQSLSAINVINGRTCLSTDAKKAICIKHGKIKSVYDDKDGVPKWTVIVTRQGQEAVAITYSARDAAQAGFMELKEIGGQKVWTGKPNSAWGGYWRRMLLKRATSWALDEAFPDLLNGISTTEELEELPQVTAPTMYQEAPRQEPANEADSVLTDGKTLTVDEKIFKDLEEKKSLC